MSFCLFRKDSKTDLEIVVFNTVDEINVADWNKVVDSKNIYVTLAYLDAIEKSLSKEIGFRYLLFYNEASAPVALAVVQMLQFYDKDYKEQEQLCHIRTKIKQRLLDANGLQIMTCGSPFSCGENGFAYTEAITEIEAYKNLARGLIQLQKKEKKTYNTPILLLKEFWPESVSASDTMIKDGFRDFMIDVNMVMEVQPYWNAFEDYLASMTAKCRTKARGAFKKSTALKIVDFQVDDIIRYQKPIESLYGAVVEKSAFRFGALNGETFVRLKRNLKDKFSISGYFLNEELVGFSSAFIFDSIVDANYVGIRYDLNQEYALYQRMLYHYVEIALQLKCREVRFGRTAEEIKSTVGAMPINMKLYIRHQNKIKNSLLKPVFGSITPSLFELRTPFKVERQSTK